MEDTIPSSKVSSSLSWNAVCAMWTFFWSWILQPTHVFEFVIFSTMMSIQLVLVVWCILLRWCLKPWRYFFLSMPSFASVNSLVTSSGRQRLTEIAAARRGVAEATSYEEFAACTGQLQRLGCRQDAVPSEIISRVWNKPLVESKLNHLRRLRETGDDFELMSSIRLAFDRGFAGLSHPLLYDRAGTAVDPLVDEFPRALADHMKHLIGPESCLRAADKDRLVREARKTLGPTALCLSGGAMLALLHVGVVRTLHAQKLLPSIISGSSGGAIVAALVCITADHELDAALLRFPSGPGQRPFLPCKLQQLKNLRAWGRVMDTNEYNSVLSDLLGDITFREAFHRTSRVLNVSVCSSGLNAPLLLNHINAPDVLVRSAVAGSCALPILLPPQELLAKDSSGRVHTWKHLDLTLVDGSIEHDLPTEKLSELFGCSHFIVSQTNPHVLPFLPRRSLSTSALGRLQRWLLVAAAQSFYRLTTLHLFPSATGRILTKVLRQGYVGRLTDVAVYVDFEMNDLGRALRQPDDKEGAEFRLRSQRATWPCVNRIRSHLWLERALSTLAAELFVPMSPRTPRVSSVDSFQTDRGVEK